MDALKQAHQRRLTRLKNLLTSYRLVREQLKVAEDELGRSVLKCLIVLTVRPFFQISLDFSPRKTLRVYSVCDSVFCSCFVFTFIVSRLNPCHRGIE